MIELLFRSRNAISPVTALIIPGYGKFDDECSRRLRRFILPLPSRGRINSVNTSQSGSLPIVSLIGPVSVPH